jgi:hypothetical protein
VPSLPPAVGQDPEPKRIFTGWEHCNAAVEQLPNVHWWLVDAAGEDKLHPHAHSKTFFCERQSSLRPSRISHSPHTLNDNELGTEDETL